MQAIIFSGIAGSGKTTFYRQKFFETHVRISLDMLKTRAREKAILQACICAKQPFVIDNTNLTAAHREHYAKAAKSAGFRAILYFFDTDAKDALARNATRSGKHRVPPVAIFAGRKKLERPTAAEPFDEIHTVKIVDNEFIVERMKP